MRGSRVQTIVNELHGEKIDIVRWNEDIVTYTINALAPAEIESIEVDEDARKIDVVVAPSQLSLAIGHKGQNVRLASKLIGYKINITAPEEEQLSIDEQLKQEFTKKNENGENASDSEEVVSEEMSISESEGAESSDGDAEQASESTEQEDTEKSE